MAWNEILILFGAGAALAGAIATLFYARRWFLAGSTTNLTMSGRLDSVGELCAAALVWGGIVLEQTGTITYEIQHGASHGRLTFTLIVTALMILACGAALGRLSLRRQLKPSQS